MLLFSFSLGSFIIFRTPLYRTFSPMSLSAAKGTAKVGTSGIAGVGEKKYLTVPAPGQALSQVGSVFQHRTKKPIILQDRTTSLFDKIPIRFELKKRLNLDYKKAKCLLMSLMYLGMPSLSLVIGLW